MMKYVRDESDDIWVFNPRISYEDFVTRNYIAPRSAGIVISESGQMYCTGGSTTLGLVSEEADTEFLRDQIK